MDTYNVALFGLIGLVIALIITGGLVSMVFGEEPSLGQLAAGATLGAVAGAASSLKVFDLDLMKTFQVVDQEMKTGLPTF
jgi:hypothetical protein